ncbi:MAG: DUF4249 domain-containing protein [Bacteroidota bacterium]|nr:DUF4249 domain-containing protein [Bacteroidota bacterium]MDP4212231.1 DUF4249 domain-containing protein [Bacteroidota bacterium]MDP4251741.1 DUF4249 domain-containing protein [Bacteroidota bacterium]
MLRLSVFTLGLLLSFSSCEKDIAIKLQPASTDLVVDASIENGQFPRVYLSSSISYFSQVDPAILARSFVHHAGVSMYDGNQTAQLKEDSVPGNNSQPMIYYYSFNAGDTGRKFVGLFNHRYDLTITVDDKTYTASTTITSINKRIDSLWWVPAPGGGDSNDVVVRARIIDPAGLGDYTRYYTRVNDGPFYPGLQSVFDDQITDGTIYSVNVDRGVDRNLTINLDNYSFFSKGDTVQIKLANIDKATYDFWRTMEYNYQSIGNPFSSPTRVISNISNGALGYFGGYAAQYTSLIIQ